MSIIVPTDAEKDWLSDSIANLLNGAKVHLFANNITVGPTTTLASFTEASFAGYAAVAISSWTAPALDGSDRAYTTASNADFIPTGIGGSGALYGYYVTDTTGAKFIGAENFAGAPISVPQLITLRIVVTLTDKSEF